MTKRPEIPSRSGVDRPSENHAARQAARRAFIHDVVNPLAAIRISAESLRAVAALTDVEMSHVGRIEEAAGTIIDLVTTLAPFAERAERRLVGPALPPRVDLYVLCCEVADLRRSADGKVIDCRAVGDPRGDWDRAQVKTLLSRLLDHAIAYLGQGAPTIISVTGLAREVRVEIHGLGWSGAHQRQSALKVSPSLPEMPAGASIKAIASSNGGIIFRLCLPRWNRAAKGRQDTDMSTVETT